MSLANEALKAFREWIAWLHFFNINGNANKLQAFLNFILEKQRYRSGILTSIANKEGKRLQGSPPNLDAGRIYHRPIQVNPNYSAG